MPVMAMDNVRFKINPGQTFQHCLGKIGIALGIVIMTVQPRPFKIVFIVYKVKGHALIVQFFNAAVLLPPTKRNSQLGLWCHLFFENSGNFVILGQHYPYIYPQISQCLRQRPNHISQPARLNEWHCLGSSDQYF
ncbi:hypothetical protein SDC9_205918 [bioreactor metagenome]|uniref:Uncharacterized protein n=1 Tax=bioreactor metagenome TaxID=1076179 RepID=A0A645J3C3_9ZZZZ